MPVPVRPGLVRQTPAERDTPKPTRARTLADEVAELLASGQAWASVEVTAKDRHLPSSQWGSGDDRIGPPAFLPVVELGFRDDSVVRLDASGAPARDLQRVARALVLPAPPT